MSFSNLKIGARLGLGFALVLALLAAIAGLGLASMGRIDARMAQIVDNHNVKIFSAGAMGENFRDISLAVASIVLVTDPGDVKDAGRKAGRCPRALRRRQEDPARDAIERQGKGIAGEAGSVDRCSPSRKSTRRSNWAWPARAKKPPKTC